MCCHGDTSHPVPSAPPTYQHCGESGTTRYNHTTDHHMDTCGMYSVHVVYHIWYKYETLLFQGGSVTQYNIMSSSQGYNVTSSPLVKDSCFESKCTSVQSVNTTGALYNAMIASINAFGVGPWSDPKQGGKARRRNLSIHVLCQ